MWRVSVFVTVYVAQLAFFLWMESLNRAYVSQYGDRVPDGFQDFVDAERFRQSNAYTLENSKLSVVHKTFVSLLLLVFILSGALADIERWITGLGFGYVGSGLIFFLILGGRFLCPGTTVGLLPYLCPGGTVRVQ